MKTIPENLTLEDYQDLSEATDLHTEILGSELAYYSFGLVSEIGELYGLVKKLYRDRAGVLSDEWIEKIITECGDCLWYTIRLASALEVSYFPLIRKESNDSPLKLISSLDSMIYFAAVINNAILGQVFYGHEGEGRIDTARRDLVAIVNHIDSIAAIMDVGITDIARANLAKLFGRKERGVLQGEGDNR